MACCERRGAIGIGNFLEESRHVWEKSAGWQSSHPGVRLLYLAADNDASRNTKVRIYYLQPQVALFLDGKVTDTLNLLLWIFPDGAADVIDLLQIR